jgi:hypothetical protein
MHLEKGKMIFALFAVLIAWTAVPASAANPFMDLPGNHWAYDAVSQLASRGIVAGYPDGTWKGGQPMTRYSDDHLLRFRTHVTF